jgi:3-dehydroquinate dehydratase / shikimate dehydrogenase
MLIGCITGPDFETAKREVQEANLFCDGLELRLDLFVFDPKQLYPFAKKPLFHTDQNGILTPEGERMSVYHNFKETPQDLEAILTAMPLASHYKIATYANTITDSLRMLAFVKKHPHVCGMCMGELGHITRILAPVVGAPLTFSAIEKPSAPGQMFAKELTQTYHFHHLNRETKIYGLIGSPVTQSPSHITHNRFFQKHGINAVYVKMHVEEGELAGALQLIQHLGFKGLSVTIPYKEAILNHVDHLEDTIGAVNTLTFQEKIYGSNTDAKAALDVLEQRTEVRGKRCILLGAGGAAKAIAHEARVRGVELIQLSRRFGNLSPLPPYDILINATSVPTPIDINELLPQKIVMEVNVAYSNSPLMQRAKELGCSLIEGIEMFEKQALGQFSRWGHRFSW